MFDTMTLTKITGAFCGALLIYLLGGWAAETIYHMGGGHGYEGEEAKKGYKIEVAAVGETVEVEEGPSFAELLAVADVDKGAKVFGKCKACHKLEDGANGTGPSLYNVVGRAAESVAGYSYSGALTAVVDVWSPEHLDGFLTDTTKYTPGTKMNFKLRKAEDRANLIAYLQSQGS
jgi:cytochrome c